MTLASKDETMKSGICSACSVKDLCVQALCAFIFYGSSVLHIVREATNYQLAASFFEDCVYV